MALKFTKKVAPAASTQKVVEKTDMDTKQKEVISEEHEQVAMEPVAVPENFAKVKMSGGKTISLGNFEFVRIDVGVEMPCAPDKIDETLEYCAGWVNGKLEEMTT